MTLLERKINGEIVSIGWVDNVIRGNWTWTCFKADSDEEYEPYSGGCACSRNDAISDVRADYREQLIPNQVNQ